MSQLSNDLGSSPHAAGKARSAVTLEFTPATAPAGVPSWQGAPPMRVVPRPGAARHAWMGWTTGTLWVVATLSLGWSGFIGGAGLMLCWRSLEAWHRQTRDEVASPATAELDVAPGIH